MATTFSPDNVVELIEEFHKMIEPILPDQFERWGQTESEYKAAMKKFTDYAKSRPLRMLQFLKGAENLHLTREEMERYFGAAMQVHGVTYDDIKAA